MLFCIIFKCLQWNCRGFSSKIKEFSNWICNFDICCLQETWLRPDTITAFASYTVFRNDRRNLNGSYVGGTAIICKSVWDPITFNIDIQVNIGIDVSFVLINRLCINNKKVIVCSLYGSPEIYMNKVKWLLILEEILFSDPISNCRIPIVC
ncbi:hypothetical protein ALC57_15457 [Trachymyrmex cornetzi]|uniref:Endonuclease/exonuclease/phosphatase domain-containing protein n=1 Tax=Trachymyrmex cornetzi TaxID=471704 RepID=A0A151IXF6_9HYME|nr:hypothetical protein ALC57_15457 [Trachymyrmex cornetzi]